MLKNYRDIIEMVAKNPIETDQGLYSYPRSTIALESIPVQGGQGLYL